MRLPPHPLKKGPSPLIFGRHEHKSASKKNLARPPLWQRKAPPPPPPSSSLSPAYYNNNMTRHRHRAMLFNSATVPIRSPECPNCSVMKWRALSLATVGALSNPWPQSFRKQVSALVLLQHRNGSYLLAMVHLPLVQCSMPYRFLASYNSAARAGRSGADSTAVGCTSRTSKTSEGGGGG
jgi:hypothetical protein